MRILEVCVDLDGGGIDRYLYNYCTRIPDIQFDFTVSNPKRGILEAALEKEGCTIYRVGRILENPFLYYKRIKAVMQGKKYDAVHVHLGYKGFLALWAARKCGIPVRIVHAHIAFIPQTKLQTLIRKICTYLTKSSATHLAACGIDAAKWVWGEKEYRANRIIVVNNAIETKQFKFSNSKRTDARKQLNIKDSTFVVGHVGRLSDQKNPLRLLEIFAEIHRQIPDSLLLMIGRGEMEEEVKRKIKELDLEKAVRLLGVRKDVSDLLNTMDVFIFPSKYEGLPFTLIETQCNGLPTLSATTVTAMVKITDSLSFLSLNAPNEIWAKEALQLAQKGRDAQAHLSIIKAGYDIDTEAHKLSVYYKQCIRG